MPYRDLRDYIEELTRRDLLYVIDDEISKDTELVPLVRLQFRGLAEPQRKAFWFKNVTDARGINFEASVLVANMMKIVSIHLAEIDSQSMNPNA